MNRPAKNKITLAGVNRWALGFFLGVACVGLSAGYAAGSVAAQEREGAAPGFQAEAADQPQEAASVPRRGTLVAQIAAASGDCGCESGPARKSGVLRKAQGDQQPSTCQLKTEQE